MTPPGQVITAAMPVPPAVALPVPAPAAGTGTLPARPVTVVNGTRVPVVSPFVYASYSGLAAPAALCSPSASAVAAAGGAGLLTAPTLSSQFVVPDFGDTASATARVLVGSGGAVVLSASFDADSREVAGDAAFGIAGVLSTETTPYCAALPSFYARGAATADASNPPG